MASTTSMAASSAGDSRASRPANVVSSIALVYTLGKKRSSADAGCARNVPEPRPDAIMKIRSHSESHLVELNDGSEAANLALAVLQAIKAVDKDQRQIRAARRKSEKIISASERPDARRCRITRPGPATRSKNEPRPVALPMRAFGQDYRSVGRLVPLFRLT